jgi:hypothetical protein
MILNKIDLLPPMEFDVSRAIANALKVDPDIITLRYRPAAARASRRGIAG